MNVIDFRQRAGAVLLPMFVVGAFVMVTLSGAAIAADAAPNPETPLPTVELPLHVRIDQAIEAGFAGPFAARSTDAEFVRRLYLDLTGRVPSAEQAREFIDDPSAYKRGALIDRLLAGPDFPRHMQVVFDAMLMERRPDKNVPSPEWQRFLRRSFAEGKPYHQLAGEIIRADTTNPAARVAAKFVLDRESEPNLLTRDVGRVFLGIDLQCAQCHDHPLINSYLQEDYYGLYSYFNRTFLFGPEGAKVLAEKAEGDATFKSVFDPSAEPKNAGPHLPGEPALADPGLAKGAEYLVPPNDLRPATPRISRRELLARAIESGQSKDFNLNLANRLWAMAMGRGLVHPVDMRHDDNPPSHPALLDDLANECVQRNYDIRAMLKEILLSEAYQRSSEWPPGLEPGQIPADRFAVYSLRPLTSDQFGWSVMQSLGIVDSYYMNAESQLRSDARMQDLLALGEGGLDRESYLEEKVYSLLNPSNGAFVALFSPAPGQPQSEFSATVHQALFLMNGDQVQGWLGPNASLLSQRLQALPNSEALAQELYLSVLSRRASNEEEQAVSDFLAPRSADRPAAISELIWALLATNEFRFSH